MSISIFLRQGNLSPKTMETFQVVATQLNALHISLNIVVYASLNPPYLVELFAVLQVIFCKFSNTSAAVTTMVTETSNGGRRQSCHAVGADEDGVGTDAAITDINCTNCDGAKRKCSHVASVCLVHGGGSAGCRGSIQIYVTTTINNGGDGERNYKVCTCVNISNLAAIDESHHHNDDCKTLCHNKY